MQIPFHHEQTVETPLHDRGMTKGGDTNAKNEASWEGGSAAENCVIGGCTTCCVKGILAKWQEIKKTF